MEEVTNLDYYNAHKEQFSLWDGDFSPAPWQLLLNKESGGRWTPLTCEQKGIDFNKFVAGELESRA